MCNMIKVSTFRTDSSFLVIIVANKATFAKFCRKEDESKEDVQNKDQNLSSRQNQNQVQN